MRDDLRFQCFAGILCGIVRRWSLIRTFGGCGPEIKHENARLTSERNSPFYVGPEFDPSFLYFWDRGSFVRASTKRKSMPREVLGTSRGLSFLPNLPQNKRLVTFSPDFFSATKRTRNTPENAHFSQVLGPIFSRPRTRVLGLKSALVT